MCLEECHSFLCSRVSFCACAGRGPCCSSPLRRCWPIGLPVPVRLPWKTLRPSPVCPSVPSPVTAVNWLNEWTNKWIWMQMKELQHLWITSIFITWFSSIWIYSWLFFLLSIQLSCQPFIVITYSISDPLLKSGQLVLSSFFLLHHVTLVLIFTCWGYSNKTP